MNRLVEALHSGRVLMMDGAMGTELQRLGMAEGECSALWNLTHPEQVAAVHAAYLEAGAEVLLTNTFMANTAALANHGQERDRISEIWEAALDCARLFCHTPPLVLADIGPFPEEPLPPAGHRADGILMETRDCPPRAMRVDIPIYRLNADPDMPVFLSFAFQHMANGEVRTFQGASPEECAISAFHPPVCAFGANCGADIDMDDLLEIVRRYKDYTDLPLFIRPNAGTPRRTSTGWDYPRSPEYMADKLWPLLEAGVTMVGGCCGTTPAHIAAFRRVVDEWNEQHVKK